MSAHASIAWDYGLRPLQHYLHTQLPQLQPPPGLDSVRLYNWLAQRCTDPIEGLALGQGYRVTDYGPVSLAMFSAQNLGQAVQVVTAHLLDFNSHVANFTVVPRAGETVVEVSFRPEVLAQAPQHRFHASVMAAATLRLIVDLVGARRSLRSLSLPLQSPHPVYGAYFQVPVALQGATVRFHFEGDLLHWPIPTANAATFEAALQLCGDRLNARLEQTLGGTAQRVVQLLASCPQPVPGMDAVAQHLHMCERTLRRRLAQEGTSFRSLLENAQWERAQVLLQQPALSAAYVSAQLGMVNPATLRAMVQRRTGASLEVYRRRVLCLDNGQREPVCDPT